MSGRGYTERNLPSFFAKSFGTVDHFKVDCKADGEEECSRPWVNVDKAIRRLLPNSRNILVGLALELNSFCITVSIIENISTLWFVLEYFVLLAWKDLFW